MTVPPLVSVVVPVFNGMPHLRAAVDSILTQTHTDLDVVLVDGGSSDDSLAYMQSIDDPRVRIEQMPKGTSAAANWTAATQAATAEYVKLVCQDDLLAPDAVERQLADLQSHPGAVMAVAQRDVIDAAGKIVYAPRGTLGLHAGVMGGMTALHAAYVHGTNVFGEPLAVLFRRAPLLDAMPWDDTIPLVLDLSTYEKVAEHGDVVVRKESVGAFRVSSSSWSTRLASEQIAQYEAWQRAYAAKAAPGASDRARAFVGLYTQAAARRAAYAWLRLRGSFTT